MFLRCIKQIAVFNSISASSLHERFKRWPWLGILGTLITQLAFLAHIGYQNRSMYTVVLANSSESDASHVIFSLVINIVKWKLILYTESSGIVDSFQILFGVVWKTVSLRWFDSKSMILIPMTESFVKMSESHKLSLHATNLS